MKLNLTGQARVMNNSGELYDNAPTRLVVGTINLVEKIADLGPRPAPKGAESHWGDYSDPGKGEKGDAQKKLLDAFTEYDSIAWQGSVNDRTRLNSV